jgi:hypothetical protein
MFIIVSLEDPIGWLSCVSLRFNLYLVYEFCGYFVNPKLTFAGTVHGGVTRGVTRL